MGLKAMTMKAFTYRQACFKHQNAYLELKYRKIDTDGPYFKNTPVAEAPAIFVWPDQNSATDGEESECIAIYWLIEED
jgi:hypothetical protein